MSNDAQENMDLLEIVTSGLSNLIQNFEWLISLTSIFRKDVMRICVVISGYSRWASRFPNVRGAVER